MPIYAYKCASCGHAEDVMQKMSDDALTQCPACGASTYAKQVTAPNFALKGSGWYVTDFRGGNKPAETSTTSGAASKPATDVKPAAATTTTAPTSTTTTPAASVPAASTPST